MNKSRSSALRILPDESNLKGSSAFSERMQWPPDRAADPPRALRGLAQIINNGLCHRCGSCVGICPKDVLGLDDSDYPAIKNLSACTDCDLCARVCPGDEFAYADKFRDLFGTEPDLHETHGQYREALLAHATDPEVREQSSSGGLVTALLLQLIAQGKIDGAVVIAADDEKLWKGKPIIARSRAEILGAMKSKYAITPTNVVFAEILKIPGRYALVGLPCQIHGYIKAAELDPRLQERVVLTIGLFCHAAIEHEAFETIWGELGSKADEATRFVSRLGKHPGTPHIELEDGSLFPVYFGDKKGYRPSSMEVINILYRLYTPERCLTCFDALAEFADISVGDPWMPSPADDIDFYQGWSFGLVRTARGKDVLQECVDAGALATRRVLRYLARDCNKHMAEEKRWRAFRVIETHRRQGKSIPSYGDPFQHFPAAKGFRFFQIERNMLSHALCFVPRWRRPVLAFFLGNGGYCLLWLNNKRRRLKFWLRDTRARWKRKKRDG